MAKHNKGNKAPVAQNTNTAQSAVASAWQKATAGIGSLASLVQGDASAVALPDLEKDQVSELDKVEPEKKIDLERVLADVSDVAKRVRDLHEDAQKRIEDLARKEEAFSRRSDENKKRTEEIHKLDEELKQRQVEIKKSESSLADKERELEKRELDARSGFAAQNVAALSDLKKEIVELESKKTEIQLGILQAENRADCLVRRVNKYLDHLPLYRQEAIFARAGLPIPQSTLAQWVGQMGVALQPLVDALKDEMLAHPVLHADETPVAMLDPGAGKTHRAYLWSYSIGAFEPVKAVVYDFAESRAGKHAQSFLGEWRGTLVCDDYSGYKALIAEGVTEAGCMAHARRKFFDLHTHHQSQIAGEALAYFQKLYIIERELTELEHDDRRRLRQEQAKPVLDEFESWLKGRRQQVPNGSATAKAIDYSLRRWAALVQYLHDGQVPIDNNWIENRIRPIATGRKNWLFAGSLRAGQRAAAIMSLIQSAKLNGHDPFAYLKDVLSRLPTQPFSKIAELLPHRWQSNPARSSRQGGFAGRLQMVG